MTKNINYLDLLYFLIIFIPALKIIYKFKRKELFRNTLVSSLRMIVQLIFVGIYLEYIFKLNNSYVNIVYILFMILISTFSSVKSTTLKGEKIVGLTFISTIIPFTMYMLIFEKLVIKLDNIFDAKYLIPIGGMVLGNCLSGQILVLNDFINSIKKNKEEYLFSLSMGANKKEALRPYVIQAMELSIKPKIANMATLGLVSLPGMMTGQILGGNTPDIAIKYQIAIMIGIFSTNFFSSYLLLKFIIKYFFDEYSMMDRKIISN